MSKSTAGNAKPKKKTKDSESVLASEILEVESLEIRLAQSEEHSAKLEVEALNKTYLTKVDNREQLVAAIQEKYTLAPEDSVDLKTLVITRVSSENKESG